MSHNENIRPKSERGSSRRKFIKTAGAAAFATQFGATYIPAHAFGKMEKPALAGIGAGGKGRTDIVQYRGFHH